MVNRSFNIGEELKEIKKEYKAGAIGTALALPEERLVDMQSTLYSILLAIENADDKERQKQSKEAIHLFNMISADLKTLQIGRKTAIY